MVATKTQSIIDSYTGATGGENTEGSYLHCRYMLEESRRKGEIDLETYKGHIRELNERRRLVLASSSECLDNEETLAERLQGLNEFNHENKVGRITLQNIALGQMRSQAKQIAESAGTLKRITC